MKKIVKWIGRILMILAFAFLVQRLWEYRESLNVNFKAADIVSLAGCCALYIATVYMCPVVYKTLLYITTGKKISYMRVADIYCKSNILKYLPGNVMQYVGRNQIAVEENLHHGEVALATILEIGIVIISAALVAMTFSWSYAVEWINNFIDIDSGTIVMIVGGVIIGCGAVAVVCRKRLDEYLKIVLKKENVFRLVGLIIYYSVNFVLGSVIYFFVLAVLQIRLTSEGYLVGIGLYALAFVLGYVTPGVPGGIGIRETILIYFFSSFMPESQILTGALIMRIISIIGDFIAWVVMYILMKKRKSIEGLK